MAIRLLIRPTSRAPKSNSRPDGETDRGQVDGELFAEVLTEWVWVRLSDGRPTAVPRELVQLAAVATAATLARRRRP